MLYYGVEGEKQKMNNFEPTNQAILTALNNLITVVAKLRSSEGGCPWDLAQTPQTLIPYVIEEAYEVVDALQSNNPTAIFNKNPRF